MKRIEAYIDVLFEELPNTKQAEEMKQELLVNSKEKYEDLIQSGMNSDEAEQKVIDGIGNANEWKQAFPPSDFEHLNSQKQYKKPKSNSAVFAIIMCVLIIVGIIVVGIIRTITFVPNGSQEEIKKNVESTEIIDNEETSNDGKVENYVGYESISIETVKYDVEIVIDDSLDTLTHTFTTDREDELVFEEKQNALRIYSQYEKEANFSIFGKNYHGKITIQLPSKMLTKVNIDNIDGTVNLTSKSPTVLLKDVSINVVSSNILLENISIEALDINTISGSIEMKNPTISKSLSIDTVSGKTEMYVSKDHPKFHVSIDGISGKYRDQRSTTGSGSVEVSVDTISGNLTISDYVE